MARTPNERRVAAALETLEAGTPLYESVLGLASAEQASGAFRQLAGEIYPATQAALMRESRCCARPSSRSNSASGWGRTASLGSAAGAWSRAGSGDGVDGYRSRVTGFWAGGDASLTPTLRAGLVSGYGRNQVRVPE